MATAFIASIIYQGNRILTLSHESGFAIFPKPSKDLHSYTSRTVGHLQQLLQKFTNTRQKPVGGREGLGIDRAITPVTRRNNTVALNNKIAITLCINRFS